MSVVGIMACTGCEKSLYCVTREYLGIENQRRLLQLLTEHGVINEVYLCPMCENLVPAIWKKGRQIFFVCRKGHKQMRISAKSGSFLGDTHLSPEQVIHFCIMWCLLPNPRFNFIRDELKCSSRTVANWSYYCREVCVNWALENRRQIGGVGTVVEIDESKFDRRKCHRGRNVKGQWIFGGVQREVKTNFFLVPVQTRDKDTLLRVIKEWILPGTTIISDCWKDYDVLQDEGFQYIRVNHSLEFISTWASGDVHGANVQKLVIPVFRQKRGHFAGYLAEYVFKEAFARGDRLHHLLLEAAKDFPPEV